MTGASTTAEGAHASTDRLSVGTLSYTKAGIVGLFAWMLWGDFCFTLMETVVPNVLNLKLKNLGATDFVMGLIFTAMPSILNVTVCPWVSFKSDRYRSRFGRRIPFILWTAPFLTLFLILLGFSHNIATALHGTFVARIMSPTTLVLLLIGVFAVGFQFFNMFVNSVYWYLFNDVVPPALLGRFLGFFRIVASLASFLFMYFIFQYAETAMHWIFLGAGLLYFFGFSLMCLMVREGSYPPPPEDRGGLLKDIKVYFRECYSHKFYWLLFLSYAFWVMSAACIAPYNVFFSENVGLDLKQIGHISAYALILATVLSYPAGMLVDRLHPMRTIILAQVLSLCTVPLWLIFLFHDFSVTAAFRINLVLTMVQAAVLLLYMASEQPMWMRILPREVYGQFASAASMVRAFGVMIGGVLAGELLDLVRRFTGSGDYVYRYLPLWKLGLQFAAIYFTIQLYRGWKRRGGDAGYVPPGFETEPDPAIPVIVPEGDVSQPAE